MLAFISAYTPHFMYAVAILANEFSLVPKESSSSTPRERATDNYEHECHGIPRGRTRILDNSTISTNVRAMHVSFR